MIAANDAPNVRNTTNRYCEYAAVLEYILMGNIKRADFHVLFGGVVVWNWNECISFHALPSFDPKRIHCRGIAVFSGVVVSKVIE